MQFRSVSQIEVFLIIPISAVEVAWSAPVIGREFRLLMVDLHAGLVISPGNMRRLHDVNAEVPACFRSADDVIYDDFGIPVT